MRDHSEIEELLALEALGGLEPGDHELLARLMAEHGPDCAECASLRAGFGETAAALGEDLEPSSLRADLEERTVAAALADPRVSAVEVARPDGSHRVRIALVAVAAAIVLVAVGATAGYLAAPSGNEQELADFLARPGVTIVPLEPIAGQGGSVTMAVAPDGAQAFVLGSDLPALAEGQVYEFWTISGDTPDSLGCASPEEGRVRERVVGDFSSADLAAVTVEAAACPSAPTTQPILVGQLS